MKDLDEPVNIVPYDPQWPSDFKDEKMRLEKALNNCFFEHIGSTAIPGMHAKPIIDIMIGVKDYPPHKDWINKLCLLGYSYYGEVGVPERLYLTLRSEKNFNLAVVSFNGNHWKHNIKFRDYLKEHPEDCREYEKIKSNAIHSGADKLLSYSDFKKSFLLKLFEKMKH